jgi:hypothetical protein
MGNNKITGLNNGASDSDAATVVQVNALRPLIQNNTTSQATTVSGTVDAITATFTPAFSGTIAAGTRIRVIATGANTVVAPTLNVDGEGARPIVKFNNLALRVGDISGSGHVLDLVAITYSGVSKWVLLNPAFLGFAPIGAPIYISTTQTYVPSPSCRAFHVVLIGRGGNGGTATTTTADNSGAGGGQAGALVTRWVSSVAASYAVTIGAAPSAVSSFIGTGVSLSATGGQSGTNSGNGGQGGGGFTGGQATGGDVNIPGHNGGLGSAALSGAMGGVGGSVPGYGAGGLPTNNPAFPNAGTGYGAGGCGGVRFSAGTGSGGAGAPSVCIIQEYA